jgi:4-carboxymuconolactone decarboxylase
VALGALSLGAAQAQNGPHNAAQAEPPLPPDINPITRNRLPPPTRADMTTDEERETFDEQTKGSLPPLRLLSPRLAKPLAEARHYIKWETQFDGRLVEIAVLTTARGVNHQFEWSQWEGHGRVPGDKSAVEPQIINLIKYCKPISVGQVPGLGEKEVTIINYGRELFGPNRRVSSPTFAQALKLFGKRGVVDLTNMMALYVATGIETNAYDTRLDVGQKELMPPMSETPLCPGN